MKLSARVGLCSIIVLLNIIKVVSAQDINENTLTKVSKEDTEKIRERIAQNMLLYQRNVGGWPKHINDVKLDYTKALNAGQVAGVKDEAFRNDATIDNGATIKEIRFLAEQFKLTGNKFYLDAAEKGIAYLLKAQYSNGGWPQFFPDTSSYRKQITFNDNAMVNVLSLLQDITEGLNHMEVINKSYNKPCANAVSKGIDCILKAQIKVKGKLTAWCAQHDKNTLLPVKARSYELVSLSGMESVAILQFLMCQKDPSGKIKDAVIAGVNWLEAVELKGYKYEDIPDSTLPKGYDRLLQKDLKSSVWARFYEVETNEPFVSGRDGIMKKNLKDIEYERRVRYAWYGTWPKPLLEIKFPAWAIVHLKNSVSGN